ncbi:MAG: hypothetical protein QXK89_04065 [Candidatus Bathyarchaeia archaeon]
MHDVIAYKVRKAIKAAKNLGYVCRDISSKEFCDYTSGETYTGDQITSNSILRCEFLMLHEIIEISELKKRGIAINKETITNCDRWIIYDAHFTALEYEIKYALNRDLSWIKLRLSHAREWLKDKELPKDLVERCKLIVDWLLILLGESKGI